MLLSFGKMAEKDKFLTFIDGLPLLWHKAFISSFVLVIFYEIGIIASELFNLPLLALVHLKIILIFFIGFICLIFLSFTLPIFKKWAQKINARRKKEFIEVVTNIIRKETKSKKK